MIKTKKKYYAHIEDTYYRLFTIEEKYGVRTPKNNFIKWYTVFEPKKGGILASYQSTIHPDKIHIKTGFPRDMKLFGDYEMNDKVGSGKDLYETKTLYEFGYDTLKEGLLNLSSQDNNNGFAGRMAYSSISQKDESVDFPDDLERPYWIGVYFTTYDCKTIKHKFSREDIDKILFYSGGKGNIVTLLKFITPEWETLKLPPGDKITGWVHPSGNLDARYHIQVLKNTTYKY